MMTAGGPKRKNLCWQTLAFCNTDYRSFTISTHKWQILVHAKCAKSQKNVPVVIAVLHVGVVIARLAGLSNGISHAVTKLEDSVVLYCRLSNTSRGKMFHLSK